MDSLQISSPELTFFFFLQTFILISGQFLPRKVQKSGNLFILLNISIQQFTNIQIKFNIPQKSSYQHSEMADKSKLIQSMTNLIHHVSSSRRNQQQIFATLSETDIKKILTNLDDSNQRLRKTTLMLLAELLNDNSAIQNKFCQLTSLPIIPGKIVFAHAFPKSIIYDPHALSEVLKILKDSSNEKQTGLFWYIDSQTKPRVLQYGKRNILNVDPLFCIVGGWLKIQKNEKKQQKIIKPNSPSISMRPFADSSEQKFIGTANGKVRLNRSEFIENQRQKEKQKEQIYQLKTHEQKQGGKNQIGQQLMTQSTKLKDNNYINSNLNLSLDVRQEKWKHEPITIQSEIKNISKTDNLYRAPATQRKQYPRIEAGSNGYQTFRYINPVNLNRKGYINDLQMKYNILNKSNGNGYSYYRIPQTSTHRIEVVKKNDTTPTTTSHKNVGQDDIKGFVTRKT